MAPNDQYTATVVVNVDNPEQIDELIKDLDRLKGALPKGNVMKGMNKELKQTQIEMRRFGRGVSNASYQIQDFIVQVSGGVDPLRSFSQQAPQLLINMGALGAVVGVVAAGLPLLIEYFRDAGDAATHAGEGAEKLADALDAIGNVPGQLGLSAWVEEYQRLDKAQAAVLYNIYEIDKARARQRVGESLGELQTLDLSSGVTVGRGAADYMAEQYQEVADSLGIAREELMKFPSAYNAVQQATEPTSEDLLVLLERLKGIQAAGTTANLDHWVKQIQSAYNATVRLNEADNQLLQEIEVNHRRASKLREENKRSRSESPFFKIVANNGNPEILKAYEARQEALKREQEIWRSLYPDVARYTDQVMILKEAQESGALSAEQYAEKMAEARTQLDGEQFSYATEAVEIFNSSFDTMLDGVLSGTRSMADAFEDLAKVIIAQLAKIAIMRAIGGAVGGPLGDSIIGSVSAKGNAFSGGNVVPFAKGGVVNGPTIFPMAKGQVGLMGEAGPEAVLPLGRNAQGELGIKGGGMSVTVNNMASGVQVTPRQTPNGLTIDVVMKQLANSVRAGGNEFSDAMEGSYSLGRGRGVY